MSPRRTTLTALLALLPVLGLLAGCGKDPTETYCATVAEQRESFSEAVSSGGPTALLDALPAMTALREDSPEDLRDDWDVVVDRLSALRDALAAADVDPGTYDRRDPPEGVSEGQQRAIEAAAGQLATPQMLQALGAVQQQARDVCQTPLTL